MTTAPAVVDDLRRRIVEGAAAAFLVEPATALELDVEAYRTWLLRRGMSASTLRSRTRLAAMFYRAHGRWDVPGEDVAAWLQTYTGWTRVTYQNHLRSVFEWLLEAGLVDEDPMPLIRKGKQPRATPSPLSPGEVEAVLGAATNDDERTWLLLGLLAGLRCHEIAKLHGRDVTERMIRVVGKGGVDATVPTHPDLWELAQRYPRDGYWFPTRYAGDYVTTSYIGGRVHQLMTSVGVPGSIHRTRHTFATTLLRAGVNIRVVQRLMRHASIETTARYLLVVDDEAKSAVSLLGVPQ